jgi:hypothetical protein
MAFDLDDAAQSQQGLASRRHVCHGVARLCLFRVFSEIFLRFAATPPPLFDIILAAELMLDD